MTDQLMPEAGYQKASEGERRSANIEYAVRGHDIQFVEIILDPGEGVIAENGAMMYFDAGIQMDTKITDGSQQNSGILGTLVSVAKRNLIGEGVFIVHFDNRANHRAKVAFSAPYLGQIVAVDLSLHSGHILCQKSAFLCGAKGTALSLGFTKKLGAGIFGGEGFVLENLQGDGMVFIHGGGSILERTLAPNEHMYVDTGSVVAFDKTVTFDVKVISGMENIFFGDENMFLTHLVGPGTVWLQSMPFGRLMANLREHMGLEEYLDIKKINAKIKSIKPKK